MHTNANKTKQYKTKARKPWQEMQGGKGKQWKREGGEA